MQLFCNIQKRSDEKQTKQRGAIVQTALTIEWVMTLGVEDQVAENHTERPMNEVRS